MSNLYRFLVIPVIATVVGMAAPAHAQSKMTITDKPQQWDDFFTWKRSGATGRTAPEVDVTGAIVPPGSPSAVKNPELLDPRDRTWMAREEIRRWSEDHS